MFDSSWYDESAVRSHLARDGVYSPPIAAPMSIRLTAWLLASRYDRALDGGVVPPMDTALEFHAGMLVTVEHREAIARSLRRVVRQAHEPPKQWTALSWAHRPSVLGAEDVIDTVTLWLHSPRPVSARGMARLRLLLSDGAGPLYISGRGDLVERLAAVLAVL